MNKFKNVLGLNI